MPGGGISCESDRISQTVNGVTTNYVLDLAAGLTQVLSDGTNTYLYGNGRIGELQPGGFAYHLSDGLGSVRQLTDEAGEVTLARSFEPYGNTLTSAWDSETVWQFTGEARDAATNLTYLRARWYASSTGTFQSKDNWPPDYSRPETYNAWLYANANPINVLDPSGHRGEWWHDLMTNQTWQKLFLDIARRHNRASSGLTNEQFGGVLAAIISIESDTLAGGQATYAPDSKKGGIGTFVNNSPEWARIYLETAPAKDWEILYTNNRTGLVAGIAAACGAASSLVAPQILKFLPNEQSLGMGNIDAGRVRELKNSSVNLYDYSGANNPIQQNSLEYWLYPSDTAAQSLEWLGASFELLLRDSETLGADLAIDKYAEGAAVSARSFAQYNRTGLASGLEGYFNEKGQPYWATYEEIIRAKQSVISDDVKWGVDHEFVQSQAEKYWTDIRGHFDCATIYLTGSPTC